MSKEAPLVSICIVNFQAKAFLRKCLHSIDENTHGQLYEVIVSDNGSTDGSVEMLREEFPEVKVLTHSQNQGFSKPMNKAMQVAQGKYVLLLNPDTLVHEGAIGKLAAFLEENPKVGIVGPKVLNPDGTLQKPCRRSEARPWDVFAYFLGLSKLFPKNPKFSGYFMGYMDEDVVHEVHGVSGSCMLIRREVIDQIGYLDEQFFAYQEDADYCLRARKAGWKVYYYPKAEIIHFGGMGGSKIQPWRSVIAWHKSYYLYYRKHFADDYPLLFNGFYYSLMGLKLGFALLRNMLSRSAFGGARKPG